MTTDDRRFHDEDLQAYVDGTLDEKRALRLHLRAQADADLGRQLEQTRALFAALDAMPVQEPSSGFDEAVLATVPLERYRSAPRRADRVLVIGDLAPSAWARALQRAGRGALAAAAAYVLVLVIGRSALQEGVSSLARAVDAGLADMASSVRSVPVLAELVGALGRGYDAVVSAGAALSGLLGGEGTVLLVGTLLGVALLAALASRDRRFGEEARS